MTTLKEISEMAAALEIARRNREQAETILRDAKENERRLSMDVLPEMMREVGLTELKLSNGAEVSIANEVAANISEERKAAAHAWLIANGYGGLVRTSVEVTFERGQGEAAAELAAQLRDSLEQPVEVSENVHAATLRAWVKEMMEAARPFPMELFGVFPYSVARIKLPKAGSK